MQANEIIQGGRVMQQSHVARVEVPLVPLAARFAGKFMLDIMPVALASVIGGFLFTQYQSGHAVPRTAAEQVTPASAEMMAMVRDEHAMMMDYLKSQMAAEKNRAAVEDAEAEAARAASDAKAAEDKAAEDKKIADASSASDPPVRHVAALTVPKALAVRSKTPAVLAAPAAPLVIAQADRNDGAGPAVAIERAPVSLLAKTFNTTLNTTLDLKDHVVAATRGVVGAIGDAIGSVGERIGGMRNTPQQFSSPS
jgi:hypothetical protein